ncbi:MAG: hypothetical protein ACLVAK_08465 [Clostridia bacterium]
MEIDTKNIESVDELDFYEKSKKFFLNKSVVKKGLYMYEVNEKHHTFLCFIGFTTFLTFALYFFQTKEFFEMLNIASKILNVIYFSILAITHFIQITILFILPSYFDKKVVKIILENEKMYKSVCNFKFDRNTQKELLLCEYFRSLTYKVHKIKEKR